MKVANLRGAASLVDSTCQYPRVFVGIGEFLIHATKKKNAKFKHWMVALIFYG